MNNENPNGSVVNEIDFIIRRKKGIAKDTSVINNFNTSCEHRLARAKTSRNLEEEKYKNDQRLCGKEQEVNRYWHTEIKKSELWNEIEKQIPSFSKGQVNSQDFNNKINEAIIMVSNKQLNYM